MLNNLLTRTVAVSLSGGLVGSVAGIAFFYEKVSINLIYLLLCMAAGALLTALIWLFVESYKPSGSTSYTSLLTIKTRTVLAILLSSMPLFLYQPYFFYKKSRVYEFWPPSMKLSTSALVLLILCIFLFPLLLLLMEPSPKIAHLKEKISSNLPPIIKSPGILLLFFGLVWFAVTTYLVLHSYTLYNIWQKDAALIDQAFWSARTGEGFFTSTLSVNNPGGSIFGLHASYALLLFFPFYLVWPHYQTLVILSNIALASAAIPLYFLGCRIVDKKAAALLAAVYLIHPTIISQATSSSIHDLNLFPVLFLAAILAFYSRRFWLFIFLAFLTILVKEDVSLTVAMFGVYALITRRSWKWSVTPIVISIVWLALAIGILNPFFNTSDMVIRSEYFSQLGNSWSEIIKNSLTNPLILIKGMVGSFKDLQLLYDLFITTGFGLPLFTAALVFSIPSLALNLLASPTPNLNTWYLLGSVTALLTAALFGIKNLPIGLKSSIERFSGLKAPTLIAVMLFIINLTFFYSWLKPELFNEQQWTDPSRFVTEFIPANASIIAPSYLTAELSKERFIIDYSQYPDREWPDPDFIVIDTEIERNFMPELLRYYPVATAAANDKDRYQLIAESGNLLIYRNLYSEPFTSN